MCDNSKIMSGLPFHIPLAIVLYLLVLCSVSQSAETLNFGIVPQQSAQKLASGWGPICKHLSKKTGIKINFATAPDIPTFENRVLSGDYDIAYMNPYHYTVFSLKPGYVPAVRERDKKIQGIVVVRKDASYKEIKELANKVIAFPSPAAFAASILTRSHFNEIGLNFTPKYVKSHDSVYLNVVKGFASAGGGVVRTFKNTDPNIRDNLRIMWKTDLFTPHAIAFHPRVSQEIRDRITDALVLMADEQKTRNLLKTINIYGFTPAKDKDWDDVRSLNIDLLMPLIQQ